LYKNNAEHQNELNGKNFVDLFIKDIIFYQRPLRSQKSNIGNCALEFREHKINELDENGKPIKNVFEKDENGKDIIVKEYLKGAPKSNPYYQEFRIWQWLYNLKIYTREDDRDVTKDFIKDTTDWENLFEFLMSKKEVGNKDVVEFLIEENNKKEVEQQIREQFSKLNDEKIRTKVNSELAKKVKELLPKYRWNYVFDNTKEKEEDKSKKYPCNETGYEIRRRLGKIENVPDTFLEMVDKKEVEITKKNEKTGKREKTGKTILVSLGSREYQLWHIIYSVTDKNEFEQALSNFAKKNNLDESPFVENFKNFKPFKSEYGSFSEKAIKKLLPLMRLGKYWNENEIPESVKERTKSIAERLEDIKDGQTIESVTDDDVQKQVLKSFSKFKNADLIDFMQGLQLYQASYLVYGRHSEAEIAGKWKSIADLEKYLEEFKQHSLRNPIVEQVITETLRVVRDIWKHYGQSAENFFDEIHIELGREMKNTAEDRAKITKQVSENENTNLRIKAMLMEFANDDSFKNQTDYSNYCKEGENLFFYKQGNNPVRPYSQTQHDILKIYEEYVLNDYTEQDLKNEKTGLTETKDGKSKELTIYDISQKSQPTKTQIEKYKLWLEQQYRSPYTGQMISLTKLFTPAYEIEHIIPKSRYFNDSFNNKVICEATVNKLKDTQLGLEFIRNNHGQIVDTGFGGTVKIFEEEAYQTFVKKHYAKNNAKRRNLLLDEIPDKMIDRQLNDTRYISKFISKLLSNIVRSETNDDGVNSTNLIPVTGKITSKLKQDWGLNDKWNELILPRFERMNQLTKSNDFTAKNKEGHTIPAIPLELSKGFKFKRIDHRHHAMDALIIACATREHVQYLNNENAKSQKFHLQRGLAKKLREFETVEIEKMEEKEKGVWVKSNKKEKREVPKAYFKPWDNFTVDSKNALEKIIVSFKQNLRVINKTVNKYQAYENGKKVTKTQTQGENWAIRKPLHKETVFAKVTLRKIKTVRLSEALKDWQSIVDKQLKQQIKTVIAEYGGSIDYEILNRYFKDRKYKFDGVDVSKVQVYYFDTENAATRKPLDTSFTERVIRESVTDTGIQKILLNHLQVKGNKPELAFSPEGIEEMNQNMLQLNDGKSHQPVYKVRVYEPVGNKFPVGFRGSKQSKYVEAAKGTNLFFAIYVDENGNRTFETIPLNIVIERLKQGLPEVPEHNDKGYLLLFHLSPNDLVYVPTKEEVENTHTKMIANLNRIYKIVSFTGNRLYAVPYYAAKSLVDKVEYTQLNKVESDIEDNLSIKHVCIKLKIDRLGGIL
jgi:CRISPR-associated endonuclease Csn1